MATVLLTLGRLPKALDIARAFAGEGWRVIVAEPFAWHLCRLSRAVHRSIPVCAPNTDLQRYLDDLITIVDHESVDIIVPISEEAMHAVLLQPRLPPGVRMYADQPSLVRALHDKLSFNRMANRLGLAVPATALVGDGQAQTLADSIDTVVKPVFSCSGTDLSFLPAGSRLPEPDPGQPLLVQARLYGAHRSAQAVAQTGRLLGLVVYRATLLTGTVAAAFERIEASDIGQWVSRFVAAINYTGFIAFDFIDDAAGVAHAIECNPRLTSGVHFFEPHDLARAIIAPDTVERMTLRPQRRWQQFYACLTESQAALFDPPRMRGHLRTMSSSRDVTFQWRDPWPFLLMTPVSWTILRRAMVGRMSLGEAATLDITRLNADQTDRALAGTTLIRQPDLPQQPES